MRTTFACYFQTDREGLARRCSPFRFLFSQIAEGIAAMIDAFGRLRSGPLGEVLFDIGIGAFSLRREVAIGLAFVDQQARGVAMLVGVVGLQDLLFIVLEAQPLETFDNRLGSFIG